MRPSIRLLVVSTLVAGGLVSGNGPAHAVKVPKTLAHSVLVGERPVRPGFSIDFVGVQWKGGHGSGSIRFLRHGRWEPWHPLVEDGVHVPGRYASALMPGGDADAFQVRAPSGVRAPQAVALNTTDGPEKAVASLPAGAAQAAVSYVTRAQWGADESLRFDSTGNEKWPPTYWPAQKLVVHHTATQNNDPDPAATVRAIYRYHAIDRGFGDIGYQYLVGENGLIYEGRWSGTDGDPGHDTAGNGVTGAHVGGYNSGTLGIALLGTLIDQGPTASAQTALEDLLADLASRHGLDPRAGGTYTNPVSGATKNLANISGHRDWAATECPGGALYARLPEIRSNVAGRMGSSPDTQPPVITNVRAGEITRRSAAITWTTDEPADSQVEYWRPGSSTESTTALDANLVTSHRVGLTGLVRGTTYNYRVRSADAAGNVSYSVANLFKTK